ncbi:hypothetical protein AKO1_009939 [Acrasis kona]|uniref:Uncharacterized protein n=1 Tax=Acrasis kona TaxID=1008807 RepID=A0AAW2ZP35_9EUKA
MLSLIVNPCTSIGFFRFGMPISDAIELLKRPSPDKKRTEYPVNKIEIIYNQHQPVTSDIVIKLVEESIVLRFEPKTQRLRHVEFNDITKVELNYEGKIFSGPSVDCTFVKIYQVFGPSTAGVMEDTVYHLSYQGITFQIPIPKKYTHLYGSDNMLIELPNGTTPVATKMVCHPGVDMDKLKLPTTKNKNGEQVEYFSEVLVNLKSGITVCKKNVKFYMSPQDVLLELGEPDKIYNKRGNKLRIHAPLASSDEGTTSVDYFFNYFSRGFDIMFNGNTHQVEKFVFHTNVAGSRDFNIYVKCNFKIDVGELLDDGKNLVVEPDLKFTTIQSFLSSLSHSKPLVNEDTTANNPFGGTMLHAYPGVIFEVLKNDYLNSVTVFAA